MVATIVLIMIIDKESLLYQTIDRIFMKTCRTNFYHFLIVFKLLVLLKITGMNKVQSLTYNR